MVQRTLIRPPQSRLGAIPDAERARIVQLSPLGLKYVQSVDRDSAYERLAARAETAARAAEDRDLFTIPPSGRAGARHHDPAIQIGTKASGGRRGDTIVQTFGKSVARQIGSSAGRMIVRGVLGSLLRGR